jgi:hypothetical protein
MLVFVFGWRAPNELGIGEDKREKEEREREKYHDLEAGGGIAQNGERESHPKC